jgi:hypothetical protein
LAEEKNELPMSAYKNLAAKRHKRHKKTEIGTGVQFGSEFNLSVADSRAQVKA